MRKMTEEETKLMRNLNRRYARAKLAWRVFRVTLSGKAPHRKAKIKAGPK